MRRFLPPDTTFNASEIGAMSEALNLSRMILHNPAPPIEQKVAQQILAGAVQGELDPMTLCFRAIDFLYDVDNSNWTTS